MRPTKRGRCPSKLCSLANVLVLAYPKLHIPPTYTSCIGVGRNEVVPPLLTPSITRFRKIVKYLVGKGGGRWGQILGEKKKGKGRKRKRKETYSDFGGKCYEIVTILLQSHYYPPPNCYFFVTIVLHLGVYLLRNYYAMPLGCNITVISASRSIITELLQIITKL